MNVLDVDESGAVTVRLAVGEHTNVAGGIAAEGHGGVAVVFSSSSAGLAFASTARAAAVSVPIDESDPREAWLFPEALIPVSDGWWLAALASWQSQHFSYAPPEWRFLHLDPEGHLLGRAHVRPSDFGGAAIADVRAEGDELHARFAVGDGDARVWHDLRIVPSGPCAPAPSGPCDPRTWDRSPDERTLADGAWSQAYDPASHELLLTRLEPDGEERWRARFGAYERLGDEPVEVNGTLLAVAVPMDAYGLGEPRTPLLRTLSAQTGATVASVELAAVRPRSSCIAAADGRVRVGVAAHERLTLFDERAEVVWSIDGSWSECRIAMLPERVVFAGARVVAETSGGPFAVVTVHVLSRDGRRLEATRLPPEPSGHSIDLLADADGAWVVWSDDSSWHRTLWRLDAAGEPTGEPRYLATLYFSPETRLLETELGPSMVWSSPTEEGVVPLCRAAALDQPPRSGGFVGLGMTIAE